MNGLDDSTMVSARLIWMIFGGVAAVFGLLVRAAMWVRSEDLKDISTQIGKVEEGLSSQMQELRQVKISEHEALHLHIDKIEAKLDKIIEAHLEWHTKGSAK